MSLKEAIQWELERTEEEAAELLEQIMEDWGITE